MKKDVAEFISSIQSTHTRHVLEGEYNHGSFKSLEDLKILVKRKECLKWKGFGRKAWYALLDAFDISITETNEDNLKFRKRRAIIRIEHYLKILSVGLDD